jgi:hypothetical protein
MPRFLTALTCAALLTLATAAPALAQLTPQQRSILARCGPIGTFTERAAQARDDDRTQDTYVDTVFKRARARYLTNLTDMAARQELEIYNAIMDAVYGGPRLTPTVWGVLAVHLCVDLSGDFAQLGPEVFKQNLPNSRRNRLPTERIYSSTYKV